MLRILKCRSILSGSRSFIENCTSFRKDEVLDIKEKYLNDSSPKKVFLAHSEIKNEFGHSLMMKPVKKILKDLSDMKLNKDYPPLPGLFDFLSASRMLAFGSQPYWDNIATVQGYGSSGCRYLAYLLFKKYFPESDIYCPEPLLDRTKHSIMRHMGISPKVYPYFDFKTKSLNIEGMVDSLKKMKPKSIVVMHASAHYPSGLDPTPDQWHSILKACQSMEHIPFFELNYQGIASGDFMADSSAVRLFADAGVQFFATQSFSSNACLYGDRIAALHVMARSPEVAHIVRRNLEINIRTISINALSGPRIVTRLIQHHPYFAEWQEELKSLHCRLFCLKKSLKTELEGLKAPGTWNHLENSKGIFALSGLDSAQITNLADKHHIYLTSEGGINMSCLNSSNIQQVAQGIHSVLTTK